ncbi:MAG: (2Fe-2S)-binding protein [Pseudomonadota bacterium]
MYVCICNALRERTLSSAIQTLGQPTVGEVYKALGCKPQCGKCISDIASMLRALRQTQTAAAGSIE